MHPDINLFPNQYFYNGIIQNGDKICQNEN